MNSREHLLRHGAKTVDLASTVLPDNFWQPPDVEHAEADDDPAGAKRVAQWIAWLALLAAALAVAAIVAWAGSASADDAVTQMADAAKAMCTRAYDQAVNSGAHTVAKDEWIANCAQSFMPAHHKEDSGATFIPDSSL